LILSREGSVPHPSGIKSARIRSIKQTKANSIMEELAIGELSQKKSFFGDFDPIVKCSKNQSQSTCKTTPYDRGDES